VPAYNFLIKRECVEAVGGWDDRFYGGEDTSLCTRLRSKGYRLGYTPDAIVFHYRRRVPFAHLRQIGNVGRHRGFFVRRGDGSSRRWYYFVPALWALLAPAILCVGILVAYQSPLPAIATVFIGWVILAALAVRRLGLRAVFFPPVLVAHHLWYGLNFIVGFFSHNLDAERVVSAKASE
jgi:hypothetical protein